MQKKQGFTLIELSMVLVIIALLVAGVLAGQELIHQAQLRSLTREYQAFDTATNAYRDKFRAMPGDDPNAYDYFGDACGTNSPIKSSGCNGGDDGLIGAFVDTYGEEVKFFEHLAKASFISGDYHGGCDFRVASNSCELTVGTNTPHAKLGNALWTITQYPCSSCYFNDKNTLLLMRSDGNVGAFGVFVTKENAGSLRIIPVLDLYSIDAKLDDGMPNTGKVGAVDTQCVPSMDASTPYDIAAGEKCTGAFLLSGG